MPQNSINKTMLTLLSFTRDCRDAEAAMGILNVMLCAKTRQFLSAEPIHIHH